jgi:hypothetical protein
VNGVKKRYQHARPPTTAVLTPAQSPTNVVTSAKVITTVTVGSWSGASGRTYLAAVARSAAAAPIASSDRTDLCDFTRTSRESRLANKVDVLNATTNLILKVGVAYLDCRSPVESITTPRNQLWRPLLRGISSDAAELRRVYEF